MIEQTKRIFVPEILYRRGSSLLQAAAVKAATPAEARGKLEEFLHGCNGNFRLHEKTPEGLVPVAENDE